MTWCLIAGILLFYFNLSQGCCKKTECVIPTTVPPTSPSSTTTVTVSLGPPQCPTDEWFLGPNRRCYLVVPSVVFTLSQPEAAFGCLGQSKSSLAIIDNEEEKLFIAEKVKARNADVLAQGGLTSPYWIGENEGNMCNTVVIEVDQLETKQADCLNTRYGFVCELGV